MEIVLE